MPLKNKREKDKKKAFKVSWDDSFESEKEGTTRSGQPFMALEDEKEVTSTSYSSCDDCDDDDDDESSLL